MPADPIPERQLFDQALDRPADERAAFLDGACAGDPELRARLDKLLASLDLAGEFFAEPTPPQSGAHEHADGIIGRYELLQQIGEGGFGTVWMAEQQKPVRRKVALKVIKLGMDTRQVVARFEAERQALALMEHPNIAKVFDGGITPGGRPYFVMELIDGVPITQYCDQAELDTPERLELFQQVCHAVQHAHQKGVIHRDLKPSNIMVALHDGVPVPKVIDFGVAKATSAELTAKTLFTEFRQMVGTPEYMAPEQAARSGQDVDTRADVYSLGVVLYEILTGSKPFDAGPLLEKGYHEMLRVIQHDTPQKPSTRISTLGQQLAVVARRRHATPASLSRLLHGDLDWIVMKALEKERSRRYVTANDLAADIGRHLQHEPVQAGPPSASYRLRKYLRRHRLGVLATSTVALAMLAGLAAALWGWWETDAQRLRAVKAEGEALVERDAANAARKLAESEKQEANAQRTRAEAAESQAIVERNAAKTEAQNATTEAARANAFSDLVEQMLGSASPEENRGKDYTVRQMLDDFDAGLKSGLAEQPEDKAALHAIMGTAYFGLGLIEKAESHMRVALEMRKDLFGEEHPLVADALLHYAEALQKGGNLSEAEPMLREALAMSRRLLGNEHWQVAEGLRGLAFHLLLRGKPAEAEPLLREALAMARKLHGDEHRNVARVLTTLGACLKDQGQWADAEAVYRQALVIERKFGPEHPAVAAGLENLCHVLTSRGAFAEAEAFSREALAMTRKLLGEDHTHVATSLNTLGICLAEQKKFAEAEDMMRQALAVSRRSLGEQHPEVAICLTNLVPMLWIQGKLDEADAFSREALRMSRKLFGDEHPSVAIGLDNLAKICQEQGKFAEAEVYLRDALAMQRRLRGKEHPDLAIVLLNLGRCLWRQGRYSEAEPPLREALAMGSKVYGNEHPYRVMLLESLSHVLEQQGRHAEAEPLLRDALAGHRNRLGDQHAEIVALRSKLINVLGKQSKFAESEEWLREALAVEHTLHGDQHSRYAQALAELGSCCVFQGKFGESEPMLREAVAVFRKLGGEPNLVVTAQLLQSLLAQHKLEEAEEVAREVLVIERTREDPRDPAIAVALAQLGDLLLQRGNPGEAEPLMRECLDIRVEKLPDSWLRYNAMSLLGRALLGLGKHDAAEPLLLEGYEKMQPPAEAMARKTEALERVVELYEGWGKAAEAATWREKLAAGNAAKK